MAEISIIVPVYNVSEYINQCIESLINQTFKDIEIIVIDDCGQDNSIIKVKKLAKTDKRIKIIYNKTNQGLAEARNIGLKHVTSEYVGFLDSDDWVAPNFYEKLYKDIKQYNADIAIGNVLYYRKEQYSLSNEFVGQWNFRKSKKIITSPKEKQFNIYACACWNKLYKTSLFKDYNLKYPKGLKIEDVPITTITTILAKKIVLVKDAILYYRQREGSIMKCAKKNRVPFDIFKIYEYTDTLLSNIENIPHRKDFIKIIDNFKIFNIYGWYMAVHADYRPEFYARMKDLFLTIDVKHNSYITKDSREIYKEVIFQDKLQEITTFKLFNFLLLITIKQFKTYTKIYLLKYIMIDKIEKKNQTYCHRLFGILPIFVVKVK